MGFLIAAVLLAASSTIVSAYRATDKPLRIDCGSQSGYTIDGHDWVADQYFEGGDAYLITTAAANSLNNVESTLRAFPTNSPGCYRIPVARGRYLVRVSFAYYNYDSQKLPPLFSVKIQDTVVESVDMTVVQSNFEVGAYYSDYIAYAHDGKLSVCFQAQSGSPGPSLVNSLEVLPVDTDAYDAVTLGEDVILSTYVRLNMGGPIVGPEPDDPGFRTWMGDVKPDQGNYTEIYVPAATEIAGAGVAPDYLPAAIFQSARMAYRAGNNTSSIGPYETSPSARATGFRMTILPVDKSNMWYIRFYFAELNVTAAPGNRVFEILLGSGSVVKAIGNQIGGFDILAKVAPLTALVVPVFFNYSQYASNYGEDLEVGVRTVTTSEMPAMLNAVELFEVIPVAHPRKKGLSGPAIAAIVIGSLLALLLAVLGGFILMRRRARTVGFTIIEARPQG